MPRLAIGLLLLAAGTVYAQQKPGIAPFRPAEPLPESSVCGFPGVQFPADMAVYAAGGYSGRKLKFQIDKSGHEATQFDVAVNSPKKPVALILGAYEPTVWNIGWTPGTRILAVVVTGYHRQAIAGLEPAVPRINSSYDNRGPCGHLYIKEENEGLNPLARRLFGRSVDLVYPAPRGSVVIGERVLNPSELVTSTAVPPESYRDQNAPLAGEAGLEDAVRKGILRRATVADAQAWADAVAAAKARAGAPRDVPPVAGGEPPPRASLPHNAFVVLKDFEFPAGLYGAHSATFFVPKGVPLPTGERGHSEVRDFNTAACQGPGCPGGR